MISKIISGPDPKEIAEPISVSIAPSDVESDIELEKKNICYESRILILADTIEAGSIVNAKVDGKDIYINVGLQLYDAVLEEAMKGHKEGDQFEAQDENDCIRDIKIISVQNVIIPEYSNETIRLSKNTMASTMEAFENEKRDYYTSMFTETYLEYMADEFTDQWLEKCNIDIDEDEKKAWVKAWIAYQKRVEEFHDFSIYEEYEGQANEMYEEESEVYFRMYLAWNYLIHNNGATEELTIEDTQFLMKIRDELSAYMAEILRPYFKVVWEEEE